MQIQINGGIIINVDVGVKNVIYLKKIIFGILLQWSGENGKYLASYIDDSAILCNEIIDRGAKSNNKAWVRTDVFK